MNAATNPFRSELVTALPFSPQGETWQQLWSKLEARDFRGAIVGPCGTGKTTLLETLVPHLEERSFQVHFYRLDTSTRHLPRQFWRHSWEASDALLLDGAEQLSTWEWQLLKRKTRSAGAFIITSHQAGRLPTWIFSETSPALLAHLCAQLGVPLPDEEIEAIYRAHNGNIRECLLELYDSMASFP